MCQSIAHHAASGLSFVHPHVSRACGSAKVDQMEIGLLECEPCPAKFDSIEPLRLALRALQAKFEVILSAEGWSTAHLLDARLWLSPVPGKDDYCATVRVVLVPTVGEPIECSVDYRGGKLPTKRGRS